MESTDQPGVYVGDAAPSVVYGKCHLKVTYAAFDTNDDADDNPELRAPTDARLELSPNASAVLGPGPQFPIYVLTSTVLNSKDGEFTFWAVDGNHSSVTPKGWNWSAKLYLGSQVLAEFTFAPDSSGGTLELGQFLSYRDPSTGTYVTKGDPGAPATLKVGTVTSGATPSVTLSGDAPNYTMDLTLPKGAPGKDGVSPPAPVFKASASTLSAGSAATAAVSGTYPNLELTFGIPRGVDGTGGSGAGQAAYEMRGTGSPYGVVTPPTAGTYYTDTAGTTGAWRWIATGTSPSSWVVAYGDTGWRNITPSGWPSDVVLMVRREGSMVRVFSQVAETPPEDVSIPPGFGYSLPAGFTFQYPYEGVPIVKLAHRSSLGVAGILAARPAHGRYFWNSVDNSPFKSGAGEYRTSDLWPSTLPGTPA